MIYFEIFTSLIECLIIVHFCNRYFEFSNKKLYYPASLLFFAVLSADNIFLSQREGFENISVIIMLIAIFAYLFTFMKGSLFEKALVSLSPTIVMMPITLLTINLVSLLMNSESNNDAKRILVLVISKLLCFIVYEIVIRIKTGRKYSLSSYQWIVMLLCFGISFLIATIIWNYSRMRSEMLYEVIAVYILLITLNLLLYLLLNKMQRDSIAASELKEVKLTLQYQKEATAQMSEKYEEIRTLKHDMKHYLTTSAELIGQGKSSEAKEYIETILQEKVDSFSANVRTGSATIDAVIGNKQVLCDKNNIRLKMLIDNQFGNMSEMDLSVLLSNLLDNAINGCYNVNDGEISLKIERKKAYLIIISGNTIDKSVLESNPTLKTDKDKNHGYGIKSMKNIVDKYNGSMNFYEKEGRFYTDIMLKVE